MKNNEELRMNNEELRMNNEELRIKNEKRKRNMLTAFTF